METIRIKNFKGFRDTGTLAIKPITILIGPNSSGKSSLIQPLLMLKQTVDSRDVTSPLVVNGSYVKLSSYLNFICNHDMRNDFEIEYSFYDEGMFPRIDGPRRKILCKHKVVFNYNKLKKRIELNRSLLEHDGDSIEIVRVKLKRSYKYQATVHLKEDADNQKEETITYPRVRPFKFYNYSLGVNELRDLRSSRISMKIRRLNFYLRNQVEELMEGINYIGPLRDTPRNLYVSGGELRKDVGLKGEYAADVLWTQTQGVKRARNLLERVNHWISSFNLGGEVKIKTIGKHTGYFQVIITNPITAIDAAISDVGFGVSQVLPLIVEGFYSSPGSTFLVEQPEIHLHPKVQADLGDLFIELSNRGKKVIVETHSEHLISRLARRVAEGNKFTKNDLAIYYFKPSKEGTEIVDIKMNDFGQFDNWPDGFFEEDYAEALIHSQLIAERMKQGDVPQV